MKRKSNSSTETAKSRTLTDLWFKIPLNPTASLQTTSPTSALSVFSAPTTTTTKSLTTVSPAKEISTCHILKASSSLTPITKVLQPIIDEEEETTSLPSPSLNTKYLLNTNNVS